jgi:ubiquinone/menaquinone biosynthesis C-methylase UbiE
MALKSFLREVPARLANLPADLAEAVLRRRGRLPPARLRYNVAGTSSRRAFVTIGERAARQIVAAVTSASPEGASADPILDFGCGCGRVAAPLQKIWPSAEFYGADIDTAAIAWCRENLRGEYRGVESALPFPAEMFRVVYAVGVFTHMDEPEQFRWLAEVHRVLRPSGLLVATTRSPELVHTRPDLPESEWQSLQTRGFAFHSGDGARFNEHTAFHSAGYLRNAWSPWFAMLGHTANVIGYRDLAVFRREERLA